MKPRQLRFVQEYLLDLDQAAAAARAGYSPRMAKFQGCRLMKMPTVKKAVEAALAKRAARVEVKQDDVLRELLRVALSDIGKAFGPDGELLPLSEMPEDVRRAIAGVEVEDATEKRGELRKVKLWDKPAALDKLMRHLGAYKDTLNLQSRSLEQLIADAAKPPSTEGSK